MTVSVDEPNLIALGARGDDERRKRHGKRTTFVRVLEVHVDAIPAAIPAGATAGEFRVIGRPASVDDALRAVKAALAAAGRVPVTAFSLADIVNLADASTSGVADVAGRLKAAGLQTIAEAPIDVLADAVAVVNAVVKAGLRVPRLTVREAAANARDRFIDLAVQIQAATGGVRAFAPLPRVTSVAQPSTGYDDVKVIAAARLNTPNIESIQVDWQLYGPKLAQVALTMGADDVDGVSALPGTLGRRRSPIEEILGNIKAAGLEPIERDAEWRSV